MFPSIVDPSFLWLNPTTLVRPSINHQLQRFNAHPLLWGNELGLTEEIQRLRVGLKSADSAYVRIIKELNTLRAHFHQSSRHSITPRLAPMSRFNGRNTDALPDWFDMVPTYLSIQLNPDSTEAMLFVVSHFDNPLTKWFLAKKALP